jgi:signal peptidase I
MEPAFQRGDVLFLTNYEENDPIRVGEIVVFKIKDRCVQASASFSFAYSNSETCYHMPAYICARILASLMAS